MYFGGVRSLTWPLFPPIIPNIIIYSVQVSLEVSHLSQIRLYLVGHPLCLYNTFLYSSVLFISAIQAWNVGEMALIHCLAITFLAQKRVSQRKVAKYFSIVASGSNPSMHSLGSSCTSEPIWSCRNLIICAQ